MQRSFATEFLLPAVTLWRREVVRFVRQKSRVIGALGTPAIFWLVIGSGLGKSFRMPGQDASVNFLQYSFPGTVILIVLFTAIFSMISIIEDRREGFLQAVLVSPASPFSIVLGKVMGSTTLAVAQALLFVCLAPLCGVELSAGGFLASLGVLVVVSVGLSALGFVIAWPMSSTQGFHAVMNLFLIPLWLLSGAFFPASGSMTGLRWIMAANPLTYGLAAFRHVLYSGDHALVQALPPFGLSIGVSAAFAFVMVILSACLVGRKPGETAG